MVVWRTGCGRGSSSRYGVGWWLISRSREQLCLNLISGELCYAIHLSNGLFLCDEAATAGGS